ncbi:hypothetical protein V6N11_055882 [Hibiscus sabdariffa]|uniref:Ubiquinone biosynthesis protein n=1 Tax=Hibiscus sabdariffa TaxID=183260 RepID=A0ABR2T274_9ROSI
MYPTAANRLLHHASLIKNSGGSHLRRLPILGIVITSSRFSTTADLQTSPNQTFHPSDSSTSSSSSSTAEDDSRHGSKNSRAEYEEEQARVLQTSLRHIIKFGWSEKAMIAGAKEVGVSPSIVGSFPRKEAALVERAMLVDEIWHAAGDEAFDIDWYVKRTFLGGIYSTTEIYMLTDRSPALFSLPFCNVFGGSCWCWNGEFFARICGQGVSEMKADMRMVP